MRTTINHTKQSWWLTLTGTIIGFDDPAGTGAPGAGEGASGEGTGEEGTEGQGAAGTGESGDGAADDTAGLKSALQKERADRKAMEKELKALRSDKQSKDDAEKSELQRAQDEAKRNSEKATKLAQGFKDSALRSAVLAAAGKAKFTDPSDALRPEILSAIGVEQDDDDPTNVTVSVDDVTAAIKKLAKDKPHYLAPAEVKQQRPPKSGSSFGGSGNSGTGDAQKDALYAKYPALRGRIS